MNESFEDWVESTIKEFVYKPEGMMNVGPRLHPLTHYMGREAAKIAWDAQQKRIEDLQKKVDSLKAEIGALKEYIDDLESEVEAER